MDGEVAVVGYEVDAQGAFACTLDEDVDVGGEGLLRVVVLLLFGQSILFVSRGK